MIRRIVEVVLCIVGFIMGVLMAAGIIAYVIAGAL